MASVVQTVLPIKRPLAELEPIPKPSCKPYVVCEPCLKCRSPCSCPDTSRPSCCGQCPICMTKEPVYCPAVVCPVLA